MPGVPEPGPGAGLPTFSLTTQNDMFAGGLGNRDDFRTAGLDAQLCLDDWVASGSWSMLTDRAARTRSDQAVFLLGRQGAFQRGPWRAAGWAGAGAQLDRRLAGQEAQNWIHDHLVHAQEVRLPYDRSRGTRGAVVAAGAAGWSGTRLGVELVAAGLVVGDGEVLAEVGPRFSLLTEGGALWVGPRWRFRDGDPGSATAARTLAHEDGYWIDLGAWVAPGVQAGQRIGWQGQVGYDPVTHAASGAVGILIFPADRAGGGRTATIEHELSLYGGGGMGAQVRFTGKDAAPGWAWIPLVLDYRFGTDPNGRLSWNLGAGGISDAELRHDMLTGGCEGLWRSAAYRAVRAVFAAQAAVGARSEGVVVEGAGARRLEGRATAAVARGSLGTRLEFGRIFILGASVDGWLPEWRNSLTAGDGREIVLNEPGWTWGIHLGGRMAW